LEKYQILESYDMENIMTLYSELKKISHKFPKKVSFVDKRKRYLYSELLSYSDKLADLFWQMGIRKGDCIAIVLRNSIEFIISYFGLMKLGAIAVPINFMITKEDEIKYIIDNSNAKGIITEKEFLKNYEKIINKKENNIFLILTDSNYKNTPNLWELIKKQNHYTQTDRDWADENDIASILYTSGTTGHPKGVILTHKNLISNSNACIEIIKPNHKEVFIALLPMFHTLCWTTNVIIPILIGAKTLIVRNITPPKPWLIEMGKEGVTIFVAVPQIYNVLAKEAKGLKKIFLKYWAFRKVWLAISGAAPLNNHIRNSFEKIFNINICEGYGLTETSPVVSINSPFKIKHGSVGQVIPGVKIKIIDDNENELKNGQVGEICVYGQNITKGYHKNIEETEKLFTKDGWLKTGDIGSIDDEGFLFIKDRKKDMIIVKGLKVFPAQIEQIINSHPKIQESAVIGIPDETGNEKIKCFCVSKNGTFIEKSEIIKYINENIDTYKRPREIEIVESLPKNSLQKILKRELLKMEIEKKMHINKK